MCFLEATSLQQKPITLNKMRKKLSWTPKGMLLLRKYDFYKKKYKVEICDVNLEQSMMYNQGSTFYQDRAIALKDELGEEHLT